MAIRKKYQGLTGQNAAKFIDQLDLMNRLAVRAGTISEWRYKWQYRELQAIGNRVLRFNGYKSR